MVCYISYCSVLLMNGVVSLVIRQMFIKGCQNMCCIHNVTVKTGDFT
jgi:hypothetical protein